MVVSKLLMDNDGFIALTDGDEEAMGLLDQNLLDPYNEIDQNRVKATFLRWNENLETFDDWCRTHECCRMNSNSNTTTTKDQEEHDKIEFDILLAGDVMYKKELPELFFKTAQHYLSQNGVLWLCHVPRSTVTHQVVIDAAEAAGFSIRIVDTKDVVVQDCPKEDLERAVVYKITR